MFVGAGAPPVLPSVASSDGLALAVVTFCLVLVIAALMIRSARGPRAQATPEHDVLREQDRAA